jgi:heme-degrading monooxygenase HmoA
MPRMARGGVAGGLLSGPAGPGGILLWQPRLLLAATVQVHPQEALVFARIITAQTTPDGIDSAIRIAQEQLPGVREQPGFGGFYLLADRNSGKLVTISLWESYEDLRTIESRAAQLRGRAAGEIGGATLGADIYDVAVHA